MMVWVVLSCSAAQQRLVDLLDRGYLAETVGLSQALNAFLDKLKSHVMQYGGSMPVALYERVVMQLPVNAAEQIPSIVEGYRDSLKNRVATGIGLTFDEAASAARKSAITGEVELYNPENADSHAEKVWKDEGPARRLESDITLPPNLFDPTVPDDSEWKETEIKPGKGVKAPSLEESMESESKLLQAMAQQMGGGGSQPQQGQPQQEQSQQEQPQQEQPQQGGAPRDLFEALNGGAVPGYNPPQQQSGQEQGSEEKEDPKKLEEEVDEAEEESEGVDDKLAASLHQIKSQIPQLMQLQETNPEAFKQSMNLINKLLTAAKKSKKAKVEKSEDRLELEELMKDFQDKAAKLKVTSSNLPIGTRLGRYKKVSVNGRNYWRSLASGQVKDDSGTVISGAQSNKNSQGKEPG